MRSWLAARRMRFLILPPLLLAAVVVALAVRGRTPPEQAAVAEVAHPARVVAVQRLDVVPRVIGHGSVIPARTWDMVAEVAGRVLEVHPQLENGAFLKQGTVLARIDPSAYRLALAQVEAQLQELAVREKNSRTSLEIERRALESWRRDLDRKRTLKGQGAVSQAAADQAERAVLQGEQALQTLANQLSLIAPERAVLEAKREDAARDLDRTVLTAPFDLRVRSVNVEAEQYAAKGAVLAEADGVAAAEVAAQIPIDRMMTLTSGDASADTSAGWPLALAERRPQRLGLDPVVRLTSGDLTVEWPATVVRVAETVDTKTRTLGVIVRVDDPYAEAAPGLRPPLARGMFVEVALRGRPWNDRLVVPRQALRDGFVWMVDGEGRLRRRAVETAFRQDSFAVLADGAPLAAGDRVVVSDLVPAVEGMAIAAVPDDDLAARVATEAGGGLRGADR